jgi:hypothetical protein
LRLGRVLPRMMPIRVMGVPPALGGERAGTKADFTPVGIPAVQ